MSKKLTLHGMDYGRATQRASMQVLFNNGGPTLIKIHQTFRPLETFLRSLL